MKESIIAGRSAAFARKCYFISKRINEQHREFIITRQFSRSSFSIAANVEEANGAESQRDFLHKISISYKEARETRFWISMMSDVGLLLADERELLVPEIDSLCSMLGKIRATMKKKLFKRGYRRFGPDERFG